MLKHPEIHAEWRRWRSPRFQSPLRSQACRIRQPGDPEGGIGGDLQYRSRVVRA